MKKTRLEKKYEKLTKPLVPVRPTPKCKELLSRQGINANVLPTHDNIVNFFDIVGLKVEDMDKSTRDCVTKEITLLNRDAKMVQTKKFISRNKKKLKAIMSRENKRDENRSKGTVIRISAPPKKYIDTN